MRSARALAARLVPASGCLEDFVEAVERHRRRPLTVMAHDFGDPYDGTGMWLATDKGDYIIVPADASPSERSVIVCHEIAHMLLGHAPASREQRVQQLASTLVGRLGAGAAHHFLGRADIAEEMEADAEHLATHLVVLLTTRAERARFDPVSDRLR